MKILISADIEGVCGITNPDQTIIGGHGYEQARKLMTAEVSAVVQGILQGAPEAEVSVVDGHGQFRNILLEELHPAARLINGKPRMHGMLGGLHELGPWDSLFLVGYHACAGSYGVLAHTINGASFARVEVNGALVGETFLNSLMAAELGVPVGLVSGDQYLAKEAAALLPHAQVVTVKTAIGNRAAEHLPLAEARKLLQEAGAKAAAACKEKKSGSEVSPHLPKGPYRVRVTTVRPFHADCFAVVPGVEREDAVTLAFTAKTATELLRFMNAFSAMAASL